MIRTEIAPKIGITITDLQNIKNIIFDLGGVVLNINYGLTIKAFDNLQFNDFDKIFTHLKQSRLFDLLETGKILPQTFRNELRKYNSMLTDEQIDKAWNAMIGELPLVNVELLKRLGKSFRLFLLSNTNAIHMKYLSDYFVKQFGENPFPQLFEQTYYSFELGLRKPHPESYLFVLENSGLKINETLFIDDLEANIEGARKADLWAYHLQNESITDIFN